jgi:hypothetical protein
MKKLIVPISCLAVGLVLGFLISRQFLHRRQAIAIAVFEGNDMAEHVYGKLTALARQQVLDQANSDPYRTKWVFQSWEDPELNYCDRCKTQMLDEVVGFFMNVKTNGTENPTNRSTVPATSAGQ